MKPEDCMGIKIRTPDLDALDKLIGLLGPLAQVINRRRLYVSVDVLPQDLVAQVEALGGELSRDEQYSLEQPKLDLKKANDFVDKLLNDINASQEELSKRARELAPKNDIAVHNIREIIKINLLPVLQSGQFNAADWLASGNQFIYKSNLLVTLREMSESKQLGLYYGEDCLGLVDPPSGIKEVVKIPAANDRIDSELLAEAFRKSPGVREAGPGVYAVNVYAVNIGVGAGVGTTGGNAGSSLQGLQGKAEEYKEQGSLQESSLQESSDNKEQSSKIRDFVEGFKRFVSSAILFRKVEPEAMSNASTAKLCGFLSAFIILSATTLITVGYIFSKTVAIQNEQKK